MTEKETLTKAAQETARLARENPTPAARQAAVDASRALSAWIAAHEPVHARGYASRAGKRQAAERRAMTRRRA